MRSPFAFLFTITLSLGASFGQDDRLAVRVDPSDASRFICDVKFATFTTPKDWRPNRSGKQTYAILTHSDETYPNVTRMISIDIGKPVAPTARLMADAFAKKWNGRVLQIPLKIDGEDGFRVKVPPSKKSVRPIDCVVVFKGERAFLLIGGAKDNQGLDKAIDDVVASWKWKR